MLYAELVGVVYVSLGLYILVLKFNLCKDANSAREQKTEPVLTNMSGSIAACMQIAGYKGRGTFMHIKCWRVANLDHVFC